MYTSCLLFIYTHIHIYTCNAQTSSAKVCHPENSKPSGRISVNRQSLTRIPALTPCILSVQMFVCCGLFLGNSTCAPVPLCFSKSEIQNPKSTNLAVSLDGAPIITQSRRHKPCSEIEVSYSAHSQLAFDASLLFTVCSAIATATCDLRAAALLQFEAITLPPPETSSMSHSSEWA